MSFQFHDTVYGHRFFDHQLPELIKALNRVADAMKPAPTPTQVYDATNPDDMERAAKDLRNALDSNERQRLIDSNRELIVSLAACITAIGNPHEYTDEMLDNLRLNSLNTINNAKKIKV
jgi:hypothetical protein